MDLLSTIIGGAIGFLSSIGTVIVTHLINKKGKLNIYYKFISSPNIHQPWGVYNGEPELFMHIRNCICKWLCIIRHQYH